MRLNIEIVPPPFLFGSSEECRPYGNRSSPKLIPSQVMFPPLWKKSKRGLLCLFRATSHTLENNSLAHGVNILFTFPPRRAPPPALT